MSKNCSWNLPLNESNWISIQDTIDSAVTSLCTKDSTLFDQNVSERTVAARLAFYLQSKLSNWHVDCEYNRILQSTDEKAIWRDHLREELTKLQHPNEHFLGPFSEFLSDVISANDEHFIQVRDEIGKSFKHSKKLSPDIIIHERQCLKLEHNLLVIELKKIYANNKPSVLLDLAKLLVFTRPDAPGVDKPRYQHGLFLEIRDSPTKIEGWRFYPNSNPEPLLRTKCC